MPNFRLTNDCLIVSLEPGPDFGAELLRIKKLPGREYDGISAWIVPIRPGLAAALERVYGEEAGSQLAALIQEREAAFIQALEVNEQINIWNMPAAEACNIAMTHHLYAVHGGDRGQYNLVHYPFKFGE